jgi:hypothetical protein
MKDMPDRENREEYDFSGGVRGKYAEEFAEETNIVLLDPDVAAEFKTPQDVNEGLRELKRRRAADQEAG